MNFPWIAPLRRASLPAAGFLALWCTAPATRACDEDPAADAALAATPFGRGMERMDHQRDRLVEAARAGQADDSRRHAAAIGEAAMTLARELPAEQQATVRAVAESLARLAERPADVTAGAVGGVSRLDLLFVQLRAPLINAASSLSRSPVPFPRPGVPAKDQVLTAPTATSPTIRADLLPQGPLRAGAPTPVILRLSRLTDDSPVTFADLAVTHTRRIHLLVVDETLGDYQHEHPEETGTPGEYRFTWQPRAGGRYHLFADLLPVATARQEYVPAMAQVSGDRLTPERAERHAATVDGYRFDLLLPGGDEPLRAGEHATVKVHVTAPDGQPARDLEPVMGAFAHGVGFSTDLRSVLHVHPLGEEPTRDTDRGGPDLDFHFLSEQPGFRRFYVQVRIAGQDRYAPFGLTVAPGTTAVANAFAPPVPVPVPAPISGPLTEADQQFLAAYERIRAALAADDLPLLSAAVANLGEESDRRLIPTNTLADARAGFSRLGIRALSLAAARPGFFVIHCPMAQQSWVQTDARVANPYYGPSMLTCGTVVRP